MKRGFVAGELAADVVVEAGVVGAEMRRAVSIRHQCSANVRVVDVGDVELAGATAALNERDDFLLRRDLAGQAVVFVAADIGFVAFDHLAGAA